MIEIFPPDYKADVMYEDFFIMKQINDFFATYNLEKEKYSDLLDTLKKSAEGSNCPDDSLRNFLIDFTVKQDNYMTVVKRMNFYYSHISNSEERKKLKVPKESCINVVIRRLFTSKPHPYHYDYFTLTAKEKAFDESLYMIRQVFGYSCRKSSFKDDNNNHSKKSMRSEKSEKSFVSSNKSGVGSFQRFRSKPSRSAGYPPINLQTISVNNMSGAFPASTRHKYSCGNKPFSPKRELSKSKIAPEEESNKNAE